MLSSEAPFVESNLPEICRKEPCHVGIDEAGRGPVLGPLVYGIFVCPVRLESQLKGLGANDSKLQTEGEREAFFQQAMDLRQLFGWRTTKLHPRTIREAMESSEDTLNTLSYNTVYDLIQGLLEVGVQIEHAYVDTLGKPETYQARLKERFPTIPHFTVRSKADSLFPIVGAASIVAKVIRDHTLREWIQPYPDQDCGSGYPSDPNTVAWLRRNHHPLLGFPAIVRASWGTAKRMSLELEAAAGVSRLEKSDTSEKGFLFSSFY